MQNDQIESTPPSTCVGVCPFGHGDCTDLMYFNECMLESEDGRDRESDGCAYAG